MSDPLHELKKGIESAYGIEINEDQLRGHVQQAKANPIIQEYEGYCDPIVRWIHNQPGIAWFVAPANVARVASALRMAIRAKHPVLTEERRARMELGSWFYTLLSFAKENGFVVDEKIKFPPALPGI